MPIGLSRRIPGIAESAKTHTPVGALIRLGLTSARHLPADARLVLVMLAAIVVTAIAAGIGA
jgi:hypothetical protein